MLHVAQQLGTALRLGTALTVRGQGGQARCGAPPYPWPMEKRINVRWSSGLDFTGTSEDGATVALGGPESPATFRPAGLVLVGLAGCTGMDAISIMSKKRMQIESYEVEAVGIQREEHPQFFTSIVVEHIIKGISIDDKAAARAIELSARKYCVVGANLASGDTVDQPPFPHHRPER